MRSPAILAAVLAFATVPVFGQDLSWEDLDRRKAILNKAVKQAAEIDLDTTADGAERAAYIKLGHALLDHPEMAGHNQAIITARQALQAATATGSPDQVSTAQAALVSIQTARYNKASSIPELKQLIEAWQAAAMSVSAETKPSPKSEKNLKQIQTMLEQLQGQLGK